MGATIRDIARAANVSIGTVSRALNGQPGLTEATRLRVVEVAGRLGYDAGQLRPRIRRLTFVMHRQHNGMAPSPFFSHVLRGVENACRTRGIVPSLLTVGATEDVAKQLRLHEPDAIAVVGFVEPETLQLLTDLQRPVALIDLWAPNLRSVNVDNAGGVALAMEHLFAMGRKRVAFIGGSLAHYTIAQRALAYRRAFYNAGMLFDPALETTIDPSLSIDAGAAYAMERLLAAHGPNKGPDAVLAYNDVAALAAIRVCLARGLRVPEDIAVIGFDDIPTASQSTLPLTTIAVDKEALGARGVEMLVDDAPPDLKVVLPVQLVARTSTLGVKAQRPILSDWRGVAA